MRAMKKTVSVLLALMLVLGMATMGMSVASAAETNTVSVTSNIAPTQTIEFNEQSEQVVATYCLQSDKNIINVEGVITYDPTVLKIADTNTANTCFPSTTSNLIANLTKTDGRIPFNASDFQNGYDFSDEAVLATVTFDIIGTGDTTVNLEVKSLTATETLGTAEDEILIEDDVDNGGYTGTAAAKVLPEESTVDPSVFIQDVRIALEGKIGLNFYLFDAPEGYDASKITVKFSGPVEDYDKTVKLTDLQAGKRKGVNIRRNDYYVYAAMMTDTVKAEIFYDGELVSTYTTNVADWVTTHMPEFASNTKGVRLLKTMLNYGASSQNFFNYKTDDLANKDNDLALEKITADTIQVPAGVGVAPNLSSMGAKFTRCGAELKEATALRVYMTVTDAAKFANASVTVDGNKLPYLASDGSVKAAVLENIPAAYYDTVYTFNFSNGTTYKQSVMNYVKGVISAQSGNEVVENLVSSIYWYNQAANDFFGA